MSARESASDKSASVVSERECESVWGQGVRASTIGQRERERALREKERVRVCRWVRVRE